MKNYIDLNDVSLLEFVARQIEIEKLRINGWTESIIKNASMDIVKAEAIGADRKHITRIRNHSNKLLAVKKIVVDKPLVIAEDNLDGLIDFLLELKNSIVIKEFECEIKSMRCEMMSEENDVVIDNSEVKRLYNRFMNLYNRFALSIYLEDKSDIEKLHCEVIDAVVDKSMSYSGKAEILVVNIKRMYRLQEKLKHNEMICMKEFREEILDGFELMEIEA